jgi:polysaccharide deacetylase family protein (PEP-CTERM system associated)
MNSTGVVNFLTVDLEEWFHVNYAGIDSASLAASTSNLPELTDRLLRLFGELGIRCSFFILGSVAEKYPSTIRRISDAGHEVASHGYGHKSVSQMSAQEFREDLRRTSDILESITGSKILGFRAPSFSVTTAILPWYYENLEALGYKYSSSVFVGKTFLYGIQDFPYRIHTPSGSGWRTQVVEIPITKVNLGFTSLPLYLRLFPAGFIVRQVRSENAAGRPAMLYLHPREIDPQQPRLPLTRAQSAIHYFGIAGCERKIQSILREAAFTTIEEYLAGARILQ